MKRNAAGMRAAAQTCQLPGQHNCFFANQAIGQTHSERRKATTAQMSTKTKKERMAAPPSRMGSHAPQRACVSTRLNGKERGYGSRMQPKIEHISQLSLRNLTAVCELRSVAGLPGASTTNPRKCCSESVEEAVMGVSSFPFTMAPCSGNSFMAARIAGNQAAFKNHTTLPEPIKATSQSTSTVRPKEALPKAASPRGVNGCQATGSRGSSGA